MKESLLKLFSSKPLQIGLLVPGLAYYIYWKGKKSAEEKALFHNDLPNGGSGIPVTGTDSTGKPIAWNPAGIANELYEALNGLLTLASTKEKVFVKITVLTDDQLTALYNTFNQLFYSVKGETMTQFIENEWNIAIVSKRPEVLQRLRGLNLQ